jgi:hypothetical protein
MPRAKMTDDQIQDEGERLFLEQAKAYYRDLRQTAQNAPLGKIIRHVEVLAVQAGRELIRQSVESIMQDQNDHLEKKKNSGNASADANDDISATDRTTS